MRPGGAFVQRPDVGVRDESNIACASSSSSRGGPMIKINVSHGSSQHEVHLPAQSTFRDVKKLLSHKTGLEPQGQRLFFRGIEKEDEEHLHIEGVKDKSKILLLGNADSKEKKHEEIRTDNEMSKASEAVAGVRAEVDKLSERVVALKMAVDGGIKVSEKEFLVSTELLMRQLLKLDGIEAEGEVKSQRKAEVCRVQNCVDALDSLKARNANPFIGASNTVSVTTEWVTFDSEVGSMSAPPSMMSSSTQVTQDLNAPPSMSSSTQVTQDLNAPPSMSSSTQVTQNLNAPPSMSSSSQVIQNLSAPPSMSSSSQVIQNLSAPPSMSSSSQVIQNLNASPSMSSSSQVIQNLNASPSMSSSTKITQDWEQFD